MFSQNGGFPIGQLFKKGLRRSFYISNLQILTNDARQSGQSLGHWQTKAMRCAEHLRSIIPRSNLAWGTLGTRGVILGDTALKTTRKFWKPELDETGGLSMFQLGQ